MSLQKRRNLDPDIEMHTGKHPLKIKPEIGMMLLQTKEPKRLPANHQKLGERLGLFEIPVTFPPPLSPISAVPSYTSL
jgi:hypothetical protein